MFDMVSQIFFALMPVNGYLMVQGHHSYHPTFGNVRSHLISRLILSSSNKYFSSSISVFPSVWNDSLFCIFVRCQTLNLVMVPNSSYFVEFLFGTLVAHFTYCLEGFWDMKIEVSFMTFSICSFSYLSKYFLTILLIKIFPWIKFSIYDTIMAN